MQTIKRLLFFSVVAILLPGAAHAGPIFFSDFNGPATSWPLASASASLKTVTATVALQPVGTIDVANSTQSSGGILFTAKSASAATVWKAAVSSGKIHVSTHETDLAKLTLAFSLSASAARPFTVSITSFDAAGKRTGGLEKQVYPAAPDFYQRYALDLTTMKPVGGGKFSPTAPAVQIGFSVDGRDWTGGAETVLRIDNVSYASPAFYVSPRGSDNNDGRTEKTAFATPQKAIDAAQPGDIVLVMEGSYAPHDIQEGAVAFRRPGTPAAWITLKNYPGQMPSLSCIGAWNAIRIGQRGTKEARSAQPALAYLELRGLRVYGDDDVARKKYADRVGKSDPYTNGNGISITSRDETNLPHHIRVADCLIENCAGGGVSASGSDWTTFEDNTIRNNCWTTIYACSGVSLLEQTEFDAADNVYKCLIRNNVVSGNRCYVPWVSVKHMSDGNGIIIDTNYVPARPKAYLGRTLVQNNLSFNNGGSGIHAFKSRRIDIINNTAYYNGATPELGWGQIFVQLCDDAHIANNILVSRPGQPINSVGKDGGDQKSTRIVRSHNVYFGGLDPKLTGEGDLMADPLFLKPSTDAAAADFHLLPGSPALKSGQPGALVPLLDLEGKARNGTPSRGAYEK